MPPPNDTPIDRAVAAYLRAKPHLSMQQALRFAGHVASDTSPLSAQEVMHNAASNDDRTQYINPREELVANGEGPLTTVIRRSPSPSERASRYWVDAIRNNHKYANGKIGTRRELLGRRLLASAIRQRGPLHSDAEALLKGFEQGQEGVEAPLLDALQEHHPEAHELLAHPVTPDNPSRYMRNANINIHFLKRKVQALKYSMGGASHGDVNNLLGQLASPEHNHTRWGSEGGDIGLRNAASDSLRDNGRDQEADLLANPRQHVIVHEGRVHPGRSYILNQLGHRFPITVDSSGKERNQYQAHDQNGQLYVGTTDSPDHVAWDFLANYPNQLNMTREEADNLMDRSSYGRMDTPWLHEEIDPDHNQPTQMSRQSYMLKKYALDPYTSKAKDIVNQNPGGYAWERSKKNPDLPGVKERVPIGTNKNLAGPLHGTKLAVVLQEIRDRFGSVDPQLKALAEKALSGKGNLQHQVSQDNTYAKTKAMITKSKLGQQAPGEVAQTAAQPFTPEKHEDLFTTIRDRLAKHSQAGTGNSSGSSDLAARAGELARSYNWHRVGAGLQVDEAVRDYINKVTGDRLKHANEAHRTVHNLFGLGSEQRRQGKVSDATHQAFWDGLRKHVNERAKGANSVYGLSARDLKDDMLHKSIRRLAEAEEHIYGTPGKAPTDPPHVGPSYANYKTAGLKQLGPNAKIAPPTFEKPAYSPTKTGVRVNPRARAAQFKRFRKKYGRAPIEGIRGFADEDMSSQQGLDPRTNAGRILQDFLMDHDDPRHMIVSDDLNHRQGGAKHFVASTNKKIGQLIGIDHRLGVDGYITNQKEYDLHDGSRLHVTRYENPNTRHSVSSVFWHGEVPNHERFEYAAVLEPEQLDQILKEHDRNRHE